MSAAIYSVGVDLGGTWIRLEAVDEKKRHLRSFKAAAPSLNSLPAFLKSRFRRWKATPKHLIVASRGIWSPAERKRLKHALRSLAQHVTVMSDVEAAWYAAFPSHTQKLTPGIIVIAGTGSIAYGRDNRGDYTRAGGLGPFVGDEGSAYWVGKTWLLRTRETLPKPSRQSVRRIAALTPRILSQAHRGHQLALGIIQEAQTHLADLVVAVSRRLSFTRSIPVSWGGGLLDTPAFRSGFVKALRQNGKRFRVVPPRLSPALAVARLF